MEDNKQEENNNPQSFRSASNPFMVGANSANSMQAQENKTELVGNKAEDKELHQSEEPSIPEETLFEWQAPEFAYTHKPVGWFFGIVALFSGLIALAVWYQQWVTVALLIIMTIAISVWATRKPKILIYRITNYGVEVEKRKYLFDSFSSYYKYMDYNQPTIDLVPAKRFGTLVSLPLATPDANEIEATISQMIPQVDHKEDIADKIFRRLRF